MAWGGGALREIVGVLRELRQDDAPDSFIGPWKVPTCRIVLATRPYLTDPIIVCLYWTSLLDWVHATCVPKTSITSLIHFHRATRGYQNLKGMKTLIDFHFLIENTADWQRTRNAKEKHDHYQQRIQIHSIIQQANPKNTSASSARRSEHWDQVLLFVVRIKGSLFSTSNELRKIIRMN